MPLVERAWYCIDPAGELALFDAENGFVPASYKLDSSNTAIEDLILDGLQIAGGHKIDPQIKSWQSGWFSRFPNPREMADLSNRLLGESFGEFARRGFWVFAPLGGSEQTIASRYQRVCIPTLPLTQSQLPPELQLLSSQFFKIDHSFRELAECEVGDGSSSRSSRR